jgi:hypothetical protein
MAQALHPEATPHLPSFITAPGQTDVLMVVMAVVLGLAVLGFGIFFLHLHTLPERLAHKSQKLQFEIVAVLGLIALFTHMHIFWVIGLLLALVEFPDFGSMMGRIAGSVEKIADEAPEKVPAKNTPDTSSKIKQIDEASRGKPQNNQRSKGDESASTPPSKPEIVPPTRKELGHA